MLFFKILTLRFGGEFITKFIVKFVLKLQLMFIEQFGLRHLIKLKPLNQELKMRKVEIKIEMCCNQCPFHDFNEHIGKVYCYNSKKVIVWREFYTNKENPFPDFCKLEKVKDKKMGC